MKMRIALFLVTATVLCGASAHARQGDPIHGVDIKLGIAMTLTGEPVHGVVVKRGVHLMLQGDPIHAVIVKRGLRRGGGDPVPGVVVKRGVLQPNTLVHLNGAPIRGYIIRNGVRIALPDGPVHGIVYKLGPKAP